MYHNVFSTKSCLKGTH